MRAILLTLLLSGCLVPKGRFELSQVQLEATRAALDDREAAFRKSLDEARQREDTLLARVAEAESHVVALRKHEVELEAELDRQAAITAEHVLHDQEACFPPVEEGEEPVPEEEVPEAMKRRRVHVEASLEEVTEALAALARARRLEMERDHQHQAVVNAFEGLVKDGLATVSRHPRGTMVRLLIAKLFNENRTTLSPLGLSIAERIAKNTANLHGYQLVIVGHTDDVATHSATHPSNWELGFAYAIGLLRSLEEEGSRLPMVAASRSGTSPMVEPVDEEARRLNRRLELLFIPVGLLLDEDVASEEEAAPSSDDAPTNSDDTKESL